MIPVSAVAAAVTLAVALILEATGQVTLGRAFAVAGFVFLAGAILAPSWMLRRHPWRGNGRHRNPL